MNRWIVPSVTLAVVAAATAVTSTVLPAVPVPQVSAPPVVQPLTAVCPSFESSLASVRVATTAMDGAVRTAPLSDPGQVDQPEGVTVLTGRTEPVLVTGQAGSTFGAVSYTRATDGPDRGLSAASCESPATQRWFSGVLLNENAQAELVLANADTIDAAVDVTIFGPDGRINAPGSRGIVIEPHTARSVPLSVLATVDGPVSLLVESSAGRVAATVRQRLWQGTTPVGSDWIPSTVAPDTDLVLPGLVGEGERQLVLTNPGDRTAAVTVQLLGETGPSAVPGTENLDVPAGATQAVDLSAGLAGQAGGLRVTSEQPIVAGLRQASSADPAKQDPAWTAALPAIGPDGVWPVPVGTKAAVVLLLSNPAEADAQVTVTLGNELGGPGEVSQQVVPAGSTLTVPVPSAKTPWVRVQAGETAVRGALQVTETLGGVPSLAVVPLLAPRSTGLEIPPVVFDPDAAR